MIYITQINVCEVCGKIVSTTEEGDVFGDLVITYPKGWMLVYNREGGGIAYCPECYEKHKTELEAVRVHRGSYD